MSGTIHIIENKREKLLTNTSFYSSPLLPKKHNHLELIFENFKVVYNDPRRFGFIKLIESTNDESRLFKGLGPEPLSKAFNAKYFFDKVKNTNKSIKDVLMDQKIVAGLGNIYVNEILFLSKVSPLKIGSKITLKNSDTIVKSVKLIIKKAILKGGTSIRDHIQPDGKLGYFKNNLKVYGKDKKKCELCKQNIKLIKQSNRSTFFCKFCQK